MTIPIIPSLFPCWRLIQTDEPEGHLLHTGRAALDVGNVLRDLLRDQRRVAGRETGMAAAHTGEPADAVGAVWGGGRERNRLDAKPPACVGHEQWAPHGSELTDVKGVVGAVLHQQN